ncbi:thiamine-phosphate kinase [Hydrogenophaga sp. PAMC20947]|uniref:thiamine-phosphate kinase n=1 Tax=Hydrogenophaga sp. PAMC20947 TaxID=2565558 RepID=UPI00109DC6FE|nr:thiamine-phosphate kinase [Hydrogenophaga sp. PAMC20947]QCB47339.1 thiamine-phosphate kinase [Hydrogenophaga sp. PAMC20947]
MSLPTTLADPSQTGEFALIARHFQRPNSPLPASVALGVGDDCALLSPTPGHQIAISSDMLVSGRHFLPDVAPAALGHKALAVNLSDLAAMGARPLGFTLALALPQVDDTWLSELAQGLFSLADAQRCPLVGGDTTRGPLNLCITVFGEVPPGSALRRSAARVGDDIYVSGDLGGACLALSWLQSPTGAPQEALARLRERLERPTPRVALGQALLGVARAAIDISDGLAGDLGHLLRASGVGGELVLEALPQPDAVAALPAAQRLRCVLQGGDDYELVFTAPPGARLGVEAAARRSDTPVWRVGQIVAGSGLHLINAQGGRQRFTGAGFDHFT